MKWTAELSEFSGQTMHNFSYLKNTPASLKHLKARCASLGASHGLKRHDMIACPGFSPFAISWESSWPVSDDWGWWSHWGLYTFGLHRSPVHLNGDAPGQPLNPPWACYVNGVRMAVPNY